MRLHRIKRLLLGERNSQQSEQTACRVGGHPYSCTSERDEYLEYVKHGRNSTKYPKVKQPGKWANEMKTYFLKEDIPVIKKKTHTHTHRMAVVFWWGLHKQGVLKLDQHCQEQKTGVWCLISPCALLATWQVLLGTWGCLFLKEKYKYNGKRYPVTLKVGSWELRKRNVNLRCKMS